MGDLRVTSVPPTWTTPRSPGLSMWRVTGGSSCSTSPRVTATATTTTHRPPDWRPASPQTVPAGCWPPATSQSAHRNTSTTGCSPWTPVTPTEDSSLTRTSCPAPAPATSPRHSPTHPLSQPKGPKTTMTEENHGPPLVLSDYLLLFIPLRPLNPSSRYLLDDAPTTELHNIWVSSWRAVWSHCDNPNIAIFVVRVAVSY